MLVIGLAEEDLTQRQRPKNLLELWTAEQMQTQKIQGLKNSKVCSEMKDKTNNKIHKFLDNFDKEEDKEKKIEIEKPKIKKPVKEKKKGKLLAKRKAKLSHSMFDSYF